MVENKGKESIGSMQRKIQAYELVSRAIFALSFGVLTIALLYKFTYFTPLTSIIIVALIVFISIYSARKVSKEEVARFLNQLFPQLEESCELVLKPLESLNLLEHLQVARVQQELQNIELPGINKKLKWSALILIVALLLSFALIKIPLSFGNVQPQINLGNAQKNHILEKILPEIKNIEVTIAPPRYTGDAIRMQKQFSIVAEDGALISWKITTSKPVKSLKLVFNDQSFELKPKNNFFSGSRIVKNSGFYQLSVDGKLSDFYKLEVIPDQPVSIKVLSPAPYTTIDFGQKPQVSLSVSLSDDYGIRDSYISATIASGQGEAVNFKEQKLLFRQTFGSKNYKLNKLINLQALGMQPGDELYFYIKALDNYNHESRSDVYFVSIQDTAQLMSIEGMASGVSIMPEYFRSQRQVIIDTEKLLKEQDSISKESFNIRSNNLGIDQKMLRLRYGKFLGEEDESGAGGHEDNAPSDESIVLGDASKLIDSYVHKHDQAEDATFFEPELKNQLKATLTEMWNSELRLRTYKPREALPYEYKALRLLKDLQQKSRAYVAKTAFKPPVLKLEKRLSGELDKIGSPVYKREVSKALFPSESLRKAVSVLEQIKAGVKIDINNLLVLQEANQKILSRAAQQPSQYLPAVSSMKNILANNATSKDILIAQRALHALLAAPQRLPQPPQNQNNSSLSSYYFKNLSRQ